MRKLQKVEGKKCGTNLGDETITSKNIFCAYVTKIMANGWNEAFADMITFVWIVSSTSDKEMTTNRGNLSASKTVTSMPSRASAEAAYEPAGPPPMIRI